MYDPDIVDVAATSAARSRELRADADHVWAWMLDASRLDVFRVNVFHADARLADAAPAELAVGSRVRIDHRFLFARELREARITRLEPFALAWTETKPEGDDWFPHSQRFVLTPRGPDRCLLENTLHGAFRLRGARWWLTPWYRHVLPRILDAENRAIAAATERAARAPRAGAD